jgi:hypothetical protein
MSALLGPREMSDLSPQSETKRTLIRSLSPNDRFAPNPHAIYSVKNSLSAKSRVKLLKILPANVIDDAPARQ